MKTLLLTESCSNASFESLPTYREHSPSPESALSSPKEEEWTVIQTDLETVFCAPRREGEMTFTCQEGAAVFQLCLYLSKSRL